MDHKIVNIRFTADNCQYLRAIPPCGFARMAIGAAFNEKEAFEDAVDQLYMSFTNPEEITFLDKVLPKRCGNKRHTLGYFIGGSEAKAAYNSEINELYVYCVISFSFETESQLEAISSPYLAPNLP